MPGQGPGQRPERKPRHPWCLRRRRLAAATRPWVIVVDNADGEPGKIADLVPRPGPGQLVIITSANREWEAYATGAGWEVIKLGLLHGSDLAADEQAMALPGELLLPGVLRLGLAAASKGSHALDLPQMLRALFGDPQDLAARLSADMTAASLIAAAIMPPEDVRQDWLSASVASPAGVPGAIDRLARWASWRRAAVSATPGLRSGAPSGCTGSSVRPCSTPMWTSRARRCSRWSARSCSANPN